MPTCLRAEVVGQFQSDLAAGAFEGASIVVSMIGPPTPGMGICLVELIRCIPVAATCTCVHKVGKSCELAIP